LLQVADGIIIFYEDWELDKFGSIDL